jgi:hypothetical protein
MDPRLARSQELSLQVPPLKAAEAPSWWEQNKTTVFFTILEALLSALFVRWFVGAGD